jgi:signal transduction histidine kinase
MKIKLFFPFILTVFSIKLLSQTSEVIHIDSIPASGMFIDKGWKWHQGDSPEFAKPDFNDSSWQPINPALDIFDLPQLPKDGTIFWLRLHLSLDSNVNQQLAMMILQSGASELYVNGVLNQRFGVVSEDPEMVKAYDPKFKPILFSLDNRAKIVLSLRYAFQPKIKYSKLFQQQNLAFKMELHSAEPAIHQYQAFNTRLRDSLVFRIGAFLMLLVSYFSIYLFYPFQKSNLSFCIYALFIWISDLLQLNTFFFNHEVAVYYFLNIILDLTQLAPLFLLGGLYSLFDQKKTWIYWTLFSFVVLGILINAFSYKYGQLISVVLISNLVNIEIVRATIKSIRSNKKGSRIIAIGGISFLISWIVFTLGFILDFGNSYVWGTIYMIGDLTYNWALLSIPIAIAIYLGLDIANTNRSLRQKLAEVESLSEEKHMLLSTQNETLEKQVTERTAALNKSLADLQSTQAQLIQSEKMASLGELTAGIAHEIQNPLNFVNNFSDLNKEMLEEMKEELANSNTQLAIGNTQEAKNKLEDAMLIANDLMDNESKINHHGKRAESIVKGMLEHSRKSSGVKEPTNINKLCEEFVRLSYHGLRAKDKTFNCDYKLDFDPDLPLVKVISQDIGRVILNIVNNAFQATTERFKSGGDLKSPPDLANPYQPLIILTTKNLKDKIEISISDNGPGIPGTIKEKIFQPFFTTKPTGQGTGLGLSLAYDIVKAHGGLIRVNSDYNADGLSSGENTHTGTEFIIQLPI